MNRNHKATHHCFALLIPLFCTLLLSVAACRHSGTPKPRGYFRIQMPEKSYQQLNMAMPYTFVYPTYARIETDVSPNAGPYWLNITFPQFDAKIHITYMDVNNNIYEIIEDNIRFAYSHAIKADAINEKILIDDVHNLYGTVFDIKGNAASPFQFFATDSVRHFLRGALYFNTVPNRDSLAPSINFIADDITRLIESIRWKNQY